MERFSRPALLIFLVALAIACVWVSLRPRAVAAAQAPTNHQTAAMNHASVNNNVINGSVHPELISDSAAYRLWLVTVSEAPSDSPSPRQVAHLRRAGLSDADISAASKVLADFKIRYAQLIADYNAAATANSDVPNYGLASFLVNRAALVQSTRDNLKASLTANGMTHLNAHIQSEKSRNF